MRDDSAFFMPVGALTGGDLAFLHHSSRNDPRLSFRCTVRWTVRGIPSGSATNHPDKRTWIVSQIAIVLSPEIPSPVSGASISGYLQASALPLCGIESSRAQPRDLIEGATGVRESESHLPGERFPIDVCSIFKRIARTG